MPTAPLSLTATMRLAKQGSKGAAATTGFICGRFTRSELQSVYEYIEAQGEHHCGVNVRPTLRKSLSRASGYTVPFGGQGYLYPDLVGMILMGMGFGISTAAASLGSEVQTVTITGTPTGGTFTLTNGVATTALAYNATAAAVQAALELLPNIGAGNVVVTGNNGGPYTVTYVGTKMGVDMTQLTAAHSLTGGTTPGVTVTTTTPIVTGTNAKGHTCTIGARDAAKWLTVLHSYGEGSDLFTLRATDARIEQWVIEAGPRGVMSTFAGVGIKEDAAAGGETGANETEYMLLPSKGACTINVDGAVFTSSLRGLRFLISNPLDRREQNLFALERADLPSSGLECGFSATGLDVDYTTYRRLKWNGPSGTGPGVQAVKGDITFNFQSAELMGAGNDAYPYKVQITIPQAEMRMGGFRAQGRDLVRFDLAGLMVDDENSNANPITVLLQNLTASY